MRPLVVLLLVAGALLALVIALTTLFDSQRSGEFEPGPAPTPHQAEPRANAELVPATAPSEPEAAARARTDDTRTALRTEAEPGARKITPGAIEGLVCDESGTPITGAEVGLLNAKPTAFDDLLALRGVEPPKPIAKVVTEAAGTFRFDRLDPSKDWSLVVTHESYATFTTDLAIEVPEGGTWKETITLEPGLTCSGTVTDAKTGAPIEGALLVVDSAFAFMSPAKSRSPEQCITDANGQYVFTNVGASPNQARVLTVSAPGYATQVYHNFTLTTVGETPVRFRNQRPEARAEGRQQDFALEPGMVIAGRVVSPEQRGVGGVEIEALSQSGTLSSRGTTTSRGNGEFLIEGLAEGLYAVRVTPTHYDAPALQRVEAGTTDVVIELFEQATVTGKVVDPAGQPVSNFEVRARVANEVNKAFGAITAKDSVRGSRSGTFTLKGIPEGSYVIEASADGYAASFSDTITATQGLVTSDVVVRLTRGGSLSGVILDGYSRAPVVGARISTQDNDWIEGDFWEMFGAMEPSATTKTKVRTDENGRFEIDLMTPGLYQVQVDAHGYSPLTVKDIQIVEGQNIELPVQVIIRGATIRGVVLGPRKTPQAGASVQLAPADQVLQGNRTVRCDGDGRYLIDNVRPGTYQLSATRSSSRSGNPFEAIGDLRQSQIEISIEDGQSYEFELRIDG